MFLQQCFLVCAGLNNFATDHNRTDAVSTCWSQNTCALTFEFLLQARLEAKSSKRRLQIDQLFDLWDLDGSGYLELSEIEMVLSKWREEGMAKFKEGKHEFMRFYKGDSSDVIPDEISSDLPIKKKKVHEKY